MFTDSIFRCTFPKKETLCILIEISPKCALSEAIDHASSFV